jgi:hypothetical protein
MDDTDDLFLALYKALDRLEELDPTVTQEDWFKLIEKTVDRTLAPHITKVEPTKH